MKQQRQPPESKKLTNKTLPPAASNRIQTQRPKPQIGTSHRILIAASPGDGKSFLAKHLVAWINPKRLVMVNPGADESYYAIMDAKPFVDTSFPRLQHVAPPLYQDKREYDSIWWPILEEGNVYTLIDELALVATANRYGDGLTYLYHDGRRRNCGSISITQKLHRIPAMALDLCDHMFVGHVQGRDLKRLEEDTQQEWAQLIANRQPHEFIYWSKYDQLPPTYFPLIGERGQTKRGRITK